MSLRYCFEESKVIRTLNASRKNDLAVVDTLEWFDMWKY